MTTDENPLRVVVADDQAAVREGLVTLLGLLPDVEVVAAAADGEQAVALTAEHAPDVVLMDLRMPRMDGLEATRRIRSANPDVKVVMLTTFADDQSVIEALRAGALGYLTKDAGRDDIVRALRSAAAGHAILDPAARSRLLAATGDGGARDAAPQWRLPPDGVTSREAEVLRLIASGLTNAAIARTLFISENTVKSHINHLFAKIGARDRAQAVAYAYRNGLAPD